MIRIPIPNVGSVEDVHQQMIVAYGERNVAGSENNVRFMNRHKNIFVTEENDGNGKLFVFIQGEDRYFVVDLPLNDMIHLSDSVYEVTTKAVPNAIRARISAQYGVRRPTRDVMHHPIPKPPLGLKPRQIHEDERLEQIDAAIVRYLHDDKVVPLEWLEERNELINRRSL